MNSALYRRDRRSISALFTSLIAVMCAGCEAPVSSSNASTQDAKDVIETGESGEDGDTLSCSIDADCLGILTDLSPCADAVCDQASSSCIERAKGDGFPCQSEDRCVPEGICLDGACFATGTISCDDANECTDDTCDSVLGCVHTPNAASCDDNDGCTEGDQCSQGTCQPGLPLQCDDENPCTLDSCESDVAGGCVFQVEPGKICDDGDACTVGETCANTGECSALQTLNCDDDNPCSLDSCDATVGCQYATQPGPCDDGDPCTVNDVCADQVCVGSTADCDDGDACTLDICDAQSGCSNTPHIGPCDDGDNCTSGDSCATGECLGVDSGCDDANDCTFDFCQPVVGCQHTPLDSASCEDGNLCTVFDVCDSDGLCLPGSVADCDDDDLCTSDTCDPSLGCVYTPNGQPCDDLNACTSDDQCTADGCTGEPLTCDDDNPCTDDQCLVTTGCVFANNTDNCDDGDPCLSEDVCSDGQCAGTILACDDGNVCTNDLCSENGVCSHTVLDTPCDNGDLCTEQDQCIAGVCTAGLSLDCDDNNACTIDICDPEQGCINAILPACLPAKAWFIVNEFDYDQPGEDETDFIELLVVGEQTVQLSDYTVELVDGSTGSPYDTHALGGAVEQLHPGERLLLGPQEMVGPLANQVAVMVVPGDFLQNGGINGNGIRVRRQNFDGSSTVVDAVSYEAAIPGSNEGDSHVGFDDQFGESAMSFARCPDGTDTEVNAADFAGVSPSPGLENDCLGGE